MDQAKNEQVTIYATFNEEEREAGNNGLTTWDTLERGRDAVLVQTKPFPYNCPQTEEEEQQGLDWVAHYWVAKITLPFSYLYVDFDDGSYILDFVPDKGIQTRFCDHASFKEMLKHDPAIYGTYIEPEAMSNPEVMVEWLPASYTERTGIFLMNGQDVDKAFYGKA